MELKTIRLDLIDPNPNQPRESLGDLTTLVDSIKRRGVLVPILVMESGTRYLTIAGHRRTGAARLAGESEIPAIIAADWTEADRLLATMAENTVRLDMTAIEIAAGYQTLLDLKVDPDDIAKATGGLSAEAVTAAAKVLPTIIGTDKYNQITIPQMVALNEFDGDKKALKKLLGAIESGRNFDYDLKSVRQAREHDLKAAAAKAELVAAGIRVIPQPNYMPGSPKSLDNYPSWGTPEEHASCPGHCAFIDYNANPRYACDKPELHGQQSTVDSQISKAQREQEEADRAARKVDWENAAEVRREFVKTQVTDNNVAAALFDWAVNRVETTDLARTTDSRDELFGTLKTSLARLVGLAVAQMEITKYNRGIMDLYDAPGYVSTTAYSGSANYIKYVRYLNTLIKVGYTATPPEQTFLDNVAALIASEVAEEAACEAARLTIDCALCSENEANGGDCTPGDDGHPDIDRIETYDDGATYDSCFCAIDPDDGASVETTGETTEADTVTEGAHEGEIGTLSTDHPDVSAASMAFIEATEPLLDMIGVPRDDGTDPEQVECFAPIDCASQAENHCTAPFTCSSHVARVEMEKVAENFAVVLGDDLTPAEAFTAESNPFADVRISKEFASDDADRMLIELQDPNKILVLMHWAGVAVYMLKKLTVNDVYGHGIEFAAHTDRPIGSALTDARLFADRYAEAHDFETAGLTVEGSTITLKFAAKGGEAS